MVEMQGLSGLEEAERRIAEEARAQTGFLNLGRLGLDGLPDSLFTLGHLHTLVLGDSYLDISGTYQSIYGPARNRLPEGLARLAAALPELLHLYLGGVADLPDLGGLERLTRLQTLDCDSTQVSDLSPLAGLSRLQSLACDSTQVSDLSPVFSTHDLSHLSAAYLKPLLVGLPDPHDWPAQLEWIILNNTRVKRLPPELWASGELERDVLEAHLNDLARAGSERQPRVKLVILGNGEVGKTQLRRRLSDLPFDPIWNSTHGIEIASPVLAHPRYAEGVQLNLWDFGGQDIYHGTHALFMRSRAVFVICWHPEFETGLEATHGDLAIERRPLAYWLDFIRHTAGRDVPVLLVRTRGEDHKAGEGYPPEIVERLAEFDHVREVVFDAKTDLGLADLRQRLSWAIDTLDDLFGAVRIGAARMSVIQALDALRESDQNYLPEDRLFRVITQQKFQDICSARDVSSSGLLLGFLNHSGDLFYREGLFEDGIILDQNWALKAIYTLFERGPILELLRQGRGRFTRAMLDRYVWADEGYDEAEQKLFLSMMEQSGIAFRISERRNEEDGAVEYAAPALLPRREALEATLEDKWSGELGGSQLVLAYPFLHSGYTHRLVAKIGELAGPTGDYWSTGIHLFDRPTGARGRIEIEPDAKTLTIRTQKGEHATLLVRLQELVRDVDREFGFNPTTVSSTLEENRSQPAHSSEMEEEGAVRIQPGVEPAPRPRLAISYARPENPDERDLVIRQISDIRTLALGRGWDVLFDEYDLHNGYRLPDFMDQIGDSDKILVVLSPKYLNSIYCMTELHRAWDKRLFSDKAFTSQVVAIVPQDMKIDDDCLWEQAGDYWYEEEQRLQATVRKFLDRGSPDYLAFGELHTLVLKFFQQTVSILKDVATVLQPKSFEQFKTDIDKYLPSLKPAPTGHE